MKTLDIILLIVLAAIWGSSFIFMRASVDAFGPIALIAVRISIAALFLLPFLLYKKRLHEFIANWRILLITGLLNSAFPFTLLAYASLSLSGGTVSILNAMTPVFTALIAHFWLNSTLNKLQSLGLLISITGLIFLMWDKVTWSIDSWLPALAGVMATLFYGLATNFAKKHLQNISPMTSSAGSLLFSALFLLVVLQFYLPNFHVITSTEWLYAILLGVLCTSLAFIIYFKLVQNIGPSKTASVTFLIPIFAFIWGYILLNEVVTPRMWIATAIILFGMSLVTGIISTELFKSSKNKSVR